MGGEPDVGWVEPLVAGQGMVIFPDHDKLFEMCL